VKTGKVVIRKYANRRLYDTSGSRYINLEDIAALIRNGSELRIFLLARVRPVMLNALCIFVPLLHLLPRPYQLRLLQQNSDVA
jgi:hypothetical protein